MTRRVLALVLLLFGGALLRLASGTELLRYVLPRARWEVAAAGLVLVLVGTAALVADRGADGRGADDRGADDRGADDPGHGAPPRIAWLAVVPVIAVLVIGPPALGAWSAQRRPAHLARPAADFAPLPRGDPARLSVADFVLRSVWGHGRTLAGRTVRLTGFVAARRPGGFTLARLVITCCAADATAAEVEVRSRAGPFPANTWVTVTGRYAGTDARTVPSLDAVSVTVTPAPVDVYE